MTTRTSFTNCQHVQDETGCLGQSFDITNDGGPELAILDAIGFNQNAASTPEPGTMTLLAAGLALLGCAGAQSRKGPLNAVNSPWRGFRRVEPIFPSWTRRTPLRGKNR